MPTNRRPLRRPRRGRISYDQEMALWLGVGIGGGSPFESEDERREAWGRHGPRLMGLFAKDGRRPQAWWTYDSPIPWPGYDCERSTLFEAGLLGEEEREHLVEYWRKEFHKVNEPGFSYCAGQRPDGRGALWLCGKAAREAHCRWADIPASLVAEWTMEPREEFAPAVT